MFYVNLTKLGKIRDSLTLNHIRFSIKIKELNKETRTLPPDRVTERLLNRLEQNINKSDEILRKLEFKRPKRGLINGLGTLIKFVTGNTDNNDLNIINENLHNLHNTQETEIQKINKLTSFANHVTSRMEEQAKTINANFEKTSSHLMFLRTINDIRTLLQNEIFESQNFLETLSKIERTISLSLFEIPNLELLNVHELIAIHNYLLKVYNPKQLIQFDSIHIFKFLETTKMIIVGTSSSINFLLKIPILNPFRSDYYQIYPIPNQEDLIMAPPKDFIVKTADLLTWTNENCHRSNNVALCLRSPVPDPCTIADPIKCTFIKIANDYKIVIQLNNNELLTSFKAPQEIIEDCEGLVVRRIIQGTNLLSSLCALTIDSKVYENTIPTEEIPLPTVPTLNLKFSKEINFRTEHIESPSSLKYEAAELQEPLSTTPLKIAHYSTTFIIAFALLFFTTLICYYRTRIASLLCYPHQTKEEEPPKGNEGVSKPGGEELDARISPGSAASATAAKATELQPSGSYKYRVEESGRVLENKTFF